MSHGLPSKYVYRCINPTCGKTFETPVANCLKCQGAVSVWLVFEEKKHGCVPLPEELIEDLGPGEPD